MAEESKIEWTDATFNPWRGCTKVSPACENCYAETMSKRNPDVLGVWGKHGTRTIAAESYWKLPVKWNKQAEAEGVRKRVFCASLADVFEGNDTMPDNARDAVYDARLRLFELIDKTPYLDWLLLTKRPDNVRHVMQEVTLGTYGEAWNFLEHMPNVWIGTTVENQKYADIRIPQLLKIPAKVRFLSVEPMLGPVNLANIATFQFRGAEYLNSLTGELLTFFSSHVGRIQPVDWVIVGGESGSNARPMQIDWVRSLREQCKNAGVPFLFKQWGEWRPIGRGTDEHATEPQRLGKKMAGRWLDGREWNELPEVAR